MHASFPAIHRLVLDSWCFSGKCYPQCDFVASTSRLRTGGKYVEVLPTLCHVPWFCEWRVLFSRFFERGVWWYYYRIIQTLDCWSVARGHCTRQLPWYFEPYNYSKGLRVASMQSNGRDTLWWMLSRRVSTHLSLSTYLCLVQKITYKTK